MVLASLLACKTRGNQRPRPTPREPAPSFSELPSGVLPGAKYLIIGGGGEPDSSEVQLEADARLAAETLAPSGVTLFAGGAGRFGVREDAPVDRAGADRFRDALGMLFLPRPRASSLRAPRLEVNGAATYESVTRALDVLLGTNGPPLLVSIATHGEGAQDPLDGYAVLWGNDGLFVRDVVDLLQGSSIVRPSRWVVASCYGGVFARVVDAVGASNDASVAMHCGVFATDEDRLASGCDADPERSHHEGYAKQLYTALGARVESGLDFDGDGRVSLLEAHAAASIRSRSFDVPVTSSEAYARRAATELNLPWETEPPEPLADGVAIVGALGRELQLDGEGVARDAWLSARQSLEERDEELADVEAMRDGAWNRLRVTMLERWPWLEDAYAPGWERRVSRERRAISAVLLDSDEAEGYREAEDHARGVAEEADALRVREAMLARLVRAYELGRIVAVLHRAAPEKYVRYQAIRACERFVPELRAGR